MNLKSLNRFQIPHWAAVADETALPAQKEICQKIVDEHFIRATEPKLMTSTGKLTSVSSVTGNLSECARA